jgi:predicted ArsR family transcriptional regulator
MQRAWVAQPTASSAQNEERVTELILQNRRVTVDEIAEQLNISIESAG